jgi:hypothetical protein
MKCIFRYPAAIRGAAFALAACLLLAGCPEEVSLTPSEEPPGEHLLRFALITDMHITDEESPARFIRLDAFLSPAWRPQEAYTPHILDATLRRINAIHASGKADGRPIDFVMAAGDVTDNAQYNELRWFIDVMDGRIVTPDSGARDGADRDVPPELNPKLPYDAVGLDPEIPWYVTCGNHDLLAAGSFSIDRSAPDPGKWRAPVLYLVAGILQLNDIGLFLSYLLPTMAASPNIITGAGPPLDPETLQITRDELASGPIIPDPDRHFLSPALFMEAFFDTASRPRGHGFTQANLDSNTLFYSFRPDSDIPIRVVVLNTVADQPPWSVPVDYGVMDRAWFNGYLKTVVRRAARDGEAIILVSHHSSKDFNKPYPDQSVKSFQFEGWLARQPNIIAHFHGHDHRHIAERMPGANPYLRVGTASLIDLPQEGRIIDVYRDASGKYTLESVFFSHIENPTALSEEGYRRAAIDAAYNRGEY